jgi:DNA-binding GntR family transcriptional regulator
MSDSSSANETYQQVRADILTGVLVPGERLQLAGLAKNYQVSSGVLREVLPRLVGEGLAKSQPQVGYSVVSISIEDLLQITECRLTIESIALRQAIEHGDLGWEARVLAAHHVLSKTTASTDGSMQLVEWIHAHASFHRELLSGCPNERLCSVAATMRDLTDMYLQWSIRASHRRDARAEHQALVDAALSRDADQAVRCITDHIQRTADHVAVCHHETEGTLTAD